MLQREAIRDLRQTAAKDALKEKTIEPKREDESMQEFKARIRKETRKVSKLVRACLLSNDAAVMFDTTFWSTTYFLFSTHVLHFAFFFFLNRLWRRRSRR